MSEGLGTSSQREFGPVLRTLKPHVLLGGTGRVGTDRCGEDYRGDKTVSPGTPTESTPTPDPV